MALVLEGLQMVFNLKRSYHRRYQPELIGGAFALTGKFARLILSPLSCNSCIRHFSPLHAFNCIRLIGLA
jgi:hypothetical protein